MTAPERFADSQIPLAPRAPSIHDPSQAAASKAIASRTICAVLCVEVPFVLGVNGPKGLETAAAMRCGVITSRPRPDADYDKSLDVILLGFGTILDQGETLSSQRVINTAGPGVMVAYHAFLEQHDARLDRLPNAKPLSSSSPTPLIRASATWRCILAT